MPQKPVNETYRRGQVWEAGFDGHFNTDDALDYVTGKVGHDAVRMPPPTTFAATQQIVRERQRAAFERSVTSRAQQFKDAFRKLDLDGDGMLSFQEFSHGLQSLGVILPPQEVRAIWGEVLPLRHSFACLACRYPGRANAQTYPGASHTCTRRNSRGTQRSRKLRRIVKQASRSSCNEPRAEQKSRRGLCPHRLQRVRTSE